MYNLPYYKEKDQQVLIRFMKEYSFAMLIGCANNIPVATQIPLLIEEREGKLFFTGHFMRHTDHHKAFEQNPNALFVFTGPHTYVSASLYSNTQTASTWNYITVHARGTMLFLDNNSLLKALEKLTDHYEGRHSPASFTNLPKEYVEKLSPAIIGFEVEVKQIDTVYKLSQNRDEPSYQRIIDHLKKGDENARRIADEMKTRKENLFYEKKSAS
jgi:transcriptional regulator